MSWEFTRNAKQIRRFLYEQFAVHGRSPNVAKIMEAMGLSHSEVIDALSELERGIMLMTEKDTDGVVIKCMPWANFPTPHAVEVEGIQKWFAGCALEAVNMPYCYPGKLVIIHSCCALCYKPITISLRDDETIGYTPKELRVHIGIDPTHWKENWV